MHWFKDGKKYKVLGMLKHHIKYCPVDNPGEVHVIKKDKFRKDFTQKTDLKDEVKTNQPIRG